MDMFTLKFTLFLEVCILTMHLYKDAYELHGY